VTPGNHGKNKMTQITPTNKELQFFNAYLEGIDFTETGDIDQPESCAELDDDFLRESLIDCLAFYSRIACYLSDDEITQAGHDFWLSRNGHGTGFFDRGYPMADKFQTYAEAYGQVHAVFDDYEDNSHL
jgi:hypothetical protein